VGVWRVENRLKVRPENRPPDAEVEKSVREALLRNPYVERYEIAVDAVDGRVYLSGTVDSLFEKGEAEEVVGGIAGVVEVRNNLNVALDRPLVYDPYVYDWYPYDYGWYTYDGVRTTRKNDWAIHEDIQSELWWSPFVDANEVAVKVDDGVATLTGTVDTWSERLAATENALEGGAVKVVNDLNVKYGPPYFLP
jgi:osmotically-inducible protein OsmY